MTRGKIIYIDKNGEAYSTIEFNGDMYPGGKADEVLERFEEGYFENYQNYERFVERFNKRNYGYAEELIHSYQFDESGTINVSGNWTDYLYIINESLQECLIKAKEGMVLLPKSSLGIVCFQQVKKIISRVTEEQTSEKTVYLQKEEFVSIIETLRDSFDLVEKVDELFRNSRDNVECDFCNGAGLQISHEGVVVLLLKKLMKDKDEWIDYFIYELDYGRKYEPGIVKDEKGNNVDLSSVEKLYDILQMDEELSASI